jgi:hypothetical protein
MHNTYLNTINGQLVGAEQSFESFNPATGEVVGTAPISSRAQVSEAIAAARAAQRGWAARPDSERKALMMQVAQVIKDNAPYLSEWITREQGKPLGGVGPDQVPGARFELWGCEVWTQVSASLDLPMEIAFEDESRRDEIHRKPLRRCRRHRPMELAPDDRHLANHSLHSRRQYGGAEALRVHHHWHP